VKATGCRQTIEVKDCDVFPFKNGKIAVKESYFKSRTA
jgi:hypothetical protein